MTINNFLRKFVPHTLSRFDTFCFMFFIDEKTLVQREVSKSDFPMFIKSKGTKYEVYDFFIGDNEIVIYVKEIENESTKMDCEVNNTAKCN